MRGRHIVILHSEGTRHKYLHISKGNVVRGILGSYIT